ncbi:MAG: ABC transporter ATP-binding protein [Pseudohongiellaceae bacterium]
MISDSNPTATSFIRLDGVTHSYQEAGNRHQVLRNIDLAIAGGEKVALLGRSGSGKSTLLNLVSGIDLPDSGTITLDGMVINTLDETRRTRFRRAQIGFIYQFFNLVPSLTAVENVALVLELNGITGQSARDQSIAMLARLGVAGKADSFPSRLSGGEQQRVAMARALVHAPGIVLADEPTGNLDARTGDQVLAVLHEVLGERGSALLMVTHSLAVARTADRIITLEEGVITEQAGDFAW